MPFKSKAQSRYMFSQMPAVAKRWAAHTPNMKILPNKLHKANPKRKPMDAEDMMDAKRGIKQTKKEERGEKS